MSLIIETIKSLHDLLSLKPATSKQITDAELQLRVSFSQEYKEYVSEFGAVLADGIELSGISNAEHRSVVTLTKREREANSSVPHTLYVIEELGDDGVIIWQDEKGAIYQSSPKNAPKQIANSLAEYIENRTKK